MKTVSFKHFIWNIAARLGFENGYSGKIQADFIKSLFPNELKDVESKSLERSLTCSPDDADQEDVNKAVFAQISNHMRCCIDALRVIRELNARSSGLKKYDVYEKAITRQRRELEKGKPQVL